MSKKCSVCGIEIEKWGCNPDPLPLENICNDCDNYVTAARITISPLVIKMDEISDNLGDILLARIAKMLTLSHSLRKTKLHSLEYFNKMKEVKKDE